ncbi:MAG TPA: GYD domain-containing protein [Bacteroidales bacterium]|nr:GYD domain-containing protein [Bacteroidales bacterium]
MATYFLFGKYTSDAVKGISASRTEKANKLIQKYGGEIRSIYALLGEKDLVIIATFPGTEQAVKSSIAISKLTGINFTTSEAIAVEDFDKMISDI